MPEVYRETRIHRERDRSPPSDDDHYHRTTRTRYKVTSPDHYERVERIERTDDYDDDRRSKYSNVGRSSGDLLEMERREARYSDRPRSAFDSAPRTMVVERDDYRDRDPERSRLVYEKEVKRERHRDRDPFDDDRGSRFVYEREVEREGNRDRDLVFRDPDRDRNWDRRSRADWDRDHGEETEMRIEKRVERTPEGDIKYERRVAEYHDEDGDGHPDVERYRKETEYYTPVEPPPIPTPVVVRQRAPEQKIIVQEAPPPAPIIVPQAQQQPGVVVIREEAQRDREVARREHRHRHHDDDYYYRHESREIGPYRHEEREYGVGALTKHRHHRDRDYASDGEFSDDHHHHHGYLVRRRRTIVRDRSSSSDDHKKELIGGALAGAGASALLASRRDKYGDLPEHRGRKVVAGAALGALGTEAFKRARSAYEDRFSPRDDESDDDHHHSRLKTGLGIAAAALAVAGATQYYKSNKIEKEEMRRGRSRERAYYSSDEYSRSRSRKRSRSRSIAKAALATAATAGLVKHFRNKSKSKSRSRSRGRSRSRSKSRLRTGAEIAAAAAAGGVAAKAYQKHKNKKRGSRSRSSSRSSDDYYDRRRRSSRSRSRSNTRSLYSEPGPADPELGLVEYGREPLPAERAPKHPDDDPGDRRHRRRHRRRNTSGSRGYSSAESDKDKKKRSRSRLRDMAAAAVGTGAAAIGIKEYKKKHRKDREERDRDLDEDDRDDRRERRSRDRHGERERDRDRDRRRYEDESVGGDSYYDDYGRTPSPPHASGGSFFPPQNGYTQHPNTSMPNVNDYSSYPPQTYQYPPPAGTTGPPPPPASGMPPAGSPPMGVNPDYMAPPPGSTPGNYPPGGPPPATGADHVSKLRTRSRSLSPEHLAGEEDGLSHRRMPRRRWRRRRTPSPEKSVAFSSLSPKSSQVLREHHRNLGQESEQSTPIDEEPRVRPRPLRRRSSDPTTNRHLIPTARPRVYSDAVTDSEDDIEYLPDRFDQQGRPLSPHGGRPPWHERHGEFEVRPRRPGDWNVHGGWRVAGTDQEWVDNIVGRVTDVLDGRGSWLGLIGDAMRGFEESDEESTRGKGRRRRLRDLLMRG